MALFDYCEQTQRFLRDSNSTFIDPGDLVVYANRARRQIAMMTQAIRKVPPISGQVTVIGVTAGGSGYTAPVVTITPPDFPSGNAPNPQGRQAIATALVSAGVITSINVNDGGAGYFQPVVTITDPTGIGATAAVTAMTPMNLLLQGQEEYRFADVDMSMFPGVGAIYSVLSVSVIYSNYRYSLPCYSFSTYQARIRNYPFQYQYVPAMMCQRGRGADGSIMTYPLPSQTYQMEWDAFCLPADLTTDQDFEALPAPWTDGVPYFAAHLAFLELQSFNNARMMLELFREQTGLYSRAALPGRATNPYGRWVLAALTFGLSALAAAAGC